MNFLPEWVERPKDEFKDLDGRAAAGHAWVFDGNYSRTREIVWGRVTAIVWLNYSFTRTFYRSLNRTTRRVFSGEELFSGNRETFKQSFMSRDSILLWFLSDYHRQRREYTNLLGEERLSGKEIFIFRHPKQAQKFLQAIRRKMPNQRDP